MKVYQATFAEHWWKAYRLSQNLPKKQINIIAKDIHEARRKVAYICKQGKCPHGTIIEVSKG
jgi:hypothetical protein